MNQTLQTLIAARKPGKRGIHGTANIYTTADYYERQFAEWVECGFSWLKLLASGDSQVNTVRLLREKNVNIIPVIRFYLTNCPANTVTKSLLQPYVDQGALIFESPFNEAYYSYENSWGGALPADWPKQMAHGWALFASEVLGAGGVPTTPAIESWRFADIFVPLFTVLAAEYPELLKQSIVAMHNRPLNHNIGYDKDPGGYRGWEWMDGYVWQLVGEHLPMIATEAGPEVGWDQDKNFARVTPAGHAVMCREIDTYPTPDYYLADCYWLWEDLASFRPASWKRNGTHYGGADLPVVDAFKSTRPVVTPPAWPVLSDDYVRGVGRGHPSQISLNPDAALFKAGNAAGLGWPETSEWEQDGCVWMKWQHGVVVVPIGKWNEVRVVRWSE